MATGNSTRSNCMKILGVSIENHSSVTQHVQRLVTSSTHAGVVRDACHAFPWAWWCTTTSRVLCDRHRRCHRNMSPPEESAPGGKI